MIGLFVTLLSLFSFLSLSFAQWNNNCGGYLSDGTTYVSLSIIEALYTLENVPYQNTNVSLQIQVCGVIPSSNSECSTTSAVNIISNSSCQSGGDAAVTAWEATEEMKGVSLIYYHGSSVSNTNDLSTRIYFECSSTAGQMEFLQYNSDYYQFQVRIKTPFVCQSNSITSPPPDPSISFICATEFMDETVDLSPLSASNGSYLFTNVDTGYDFELQICGIVKTNYSICNTTNSAANIISNGVCKSAGSATAFAWDINPHSSAGVSLTIYHGTSVGNGGNLQTRVYFECSILWDKNFNSAQPLPLNHLEFEHFTSTAGNGGEYHLIIKTPYACPSSLPTSSSTSSSSSSSSFVLYLSHAFVILFAILAL